MNLTCVCVWNRILFSLSVYCQLIRTRTHSERSEHSELLMLIIYIDMHCKILHPVLSWSLPSAVFWISLLTMPMTPQLSVQTDIIIHVDGVHTVCILYIIIFLQSKTNTKDNPTSFSFKRCSDSLPLCNACLIKSR